MMDVRDECSIQHRPVAIRSPLADKKFEQVNKLFQKINTSLEPV